MRSSGAILWIFGMPTDSFLLREVFSFCHEFTLILNTKWRDLNSRLGGCGIYVSEIYFSEIYFSIFLKNKEGEKDWSDPQSDSMIQLKARGLLHMECEYFVHHIWSTFRGLSISQPWSSRKYLEDYTTYLKEGLKATRRVFWLLEVLEDAVQVLDTCRTQLRRARGLVRPGTAGLLTGIECSRVRQYKPPHKT